MSITKLSSGRRLLEAMLILCSLFAIWLMAALLSFNPSDPSWSQTAWHEPIHNLGGAPGAWLADTLFFIFGVMAYTIPVIIIGGCWFAWRHQENDEYIDYFAVSLRLIGALALILTSCGLAAINADDIWYFASGGVIGSLLSTTLQPLLHSSGGTIALLCIWAAGLTLFTGWSWVSIAEKLGGGILSVLTFASNRTRRDDTWVDEGEYEDDDEEYDDEEAATPQESRRARILRSALARRKRLAEKFTNPMGRKTDAALFLPILFAPFYRVEKSRNKTTGGSGLGLYITKAILDQHGFSYRLENTNSGVRFTMEFCNKAEPKRGIAPRAICN